MPSMWIQWLGLDAEAIVDALPRCRLPCGDAVSCGMPDEPLIEEQLTASVIGAFFEVYNTLGFRFFEQVYMAALERELRGRDHLVGREVWVPIFYKGEIISRQRIDMIVDEKLVVEAFYRLVHTEPAKTVGGSKRPTD